MKCNVLLAYPPYKLYQTVPPLGLGYLASYLREMREDVDVRIIDYNVEGSLTHFYRRDLKKDLESFDIIGIGFMTPMVDEAFHLAKIANTMGKPVIFGGPHAAALPEEMLSSGLVDVVVRGEGEQTLAELCGLWAEGSRFEDLSDVVGISYVEDGGVTHNPDRPFIQDLDSIPFPARDLLNLDAYRVRYPGLAFSKPTVNIIGSRGCPNRCIFCASCVIWKRKTRFRSPENIVEELESVISGFGVTQFNFNDDTFTLKTDNVIRMCEMIIDRGLDLRWACSTRVTSADKEMFEMMKKSGCTRIGLGIESANPDVLKNIKKGITVEKASRAVRFAKEAGLEVITYFLVGNPGENRKSIKDTIDFIVEHELDSFPGVVEPLPGTELYEIAKERGWLRDFKWSQLLKAENRTIVRTEELSHEDVETLTMVSKIVLNRARRGLLYGFGSFLYHMTHRPDLAGRIFAETLGYYVNPGKWS
ncbi:MAG: B12-binding domain-containing radical SAM protein [Thermoplasmata archaeon]